VNFHQHLRMNLADFNYMFYYRHIIKGLCFKFCYASSKLAGLFYITFVISLQNVLIDVGYYNEECI
jgi:hypothetical protein